MQRQTCIDLSLKWGLEWIRPFGKWDDVVNSGGIKGVLLGLTGKFSRGIASIQKAIEIAGETNSVLAMRFLYARLAEYLKRYGELLDRKGDPAGTHTCTARAEDLGRRIGCRL